MKQRRFYYLSKVEFLGFRYSGWQKQPGQKTVEGMLHKTLKFILPEQKFKIVGAGRTDAKVSALDAAFELFLEDGPLNDINSFLLAFNANLPPDIRIKSIEEVDKAFNVIKQAKGKEYIYLFSYGQKNHPFCAPFLANIQEDLDLELMKKGAKLFVGQHNFSSYTAQLKENTRVVRNITACEIQENTILKASFFPDKSYALRVTGEGFMRYQVRMMMGALIQLGRGQMEYTDFRESLQEGNSIQLDYVAPGSGLLLHSLEFE